MFARHYLRNLGWFLFLELLRCFSSLGSLRFSYIFRERYPCGWVSPFGHVRIKAYLPAPRTFSQAITSFIACNRLGIHHMHSFTWPYNVKTWTLLNSNLAAHETPAIGFLKQLFLYSKVVEYKMVYFTYICFKNFHSWNSCEQNVFDFAINNIFRLRNILPIWIYQVITTCIFSLLLPSC